MKSPVFSVREEMTAKECICTFRQAFGHGARIKITSARRIAIGHFHSDECGVPNEWLKLAPQARSVSRSYRRRAKFFRQIYHGAKVLELFGR
jgi:hypothetical protein